MNRETQGREGEDDVKKYGVVGVVPWWGIPVDVKGIIMSGSTVVK